MSALLPAAERDRLAKILGRLGSDHSGERAAAGLKADQLVRGAGLTWPDVLRPPTLPPPTPPRQWAEPCSPPDAAAQCLRWRECLTSWEAEFCASVLGCWKLSPKQLRVLGRLVDKCRTFAEGEI